ncbi:MAG: ARMT1-like domain-containing protein [Dehalococcoidia bacterium]|nr:ARMT1-like domain-containing protein [Dehalococcoidia bacterium]
MRVTHHCNNCLSKLVVQAVELATDHPEVRELACRRAGLVLSEKFQPGSISIVIAAELHEAVKKATGNPDPYRKMKDGEIVMARKLYNAMKGLYRENFEDYLKLAALGNAIDFFRPVEEVKREMSAGKIEFTIDDSALLEDKVREARRILFLADNTGEIVFDLPLLQLMRKHAAVTFVVKAAPVQNDITLDEIKRAGLQDSIGDVITTGTATAGIDFSVASQEFIEAFETADLVFAKGMGYYETLEELPQRKRIFYCLKAKCQPVADSLNVPLHSYSAMLR